MKFLMNYAQTNEDISIECDHVPNAVTRKARRYEKREGYPC